jgi:hypothetical protein
VSTTASQAVDKLMSELVRQDMVNVLPDYLNQTIRDLHGTNYPGLPSMPVKLRANLQELTISPNIDDGYVWTIPNFTRHQFLTAAYYVDGEVRTHY